MAGPNFKSIESQKISAVVGGASITPNDSSDLTFPHRGLLLDTDGALKVSFRDGTTVSFTGLKAGVIYPFQCQRIFATGTDSAAVFLVR